MQPRRSPASRPGAAPLTHIIPAMLAGLSVASWTLILMSVGAGLAIEIAFFRAHRGRPPSEGHRR
jgi:hypothetical protein